MSSTPVTATFGVVPPMTIRAPRRVNPPHTIDDIYLIASKLPCRTAISRLSHDLSENRYRRAMTAVTAIPMPTAKSVAMDLICPSTARSTFHAAVGSADSTLIRPTRLLVIFSVGMRLLPSKRAIACSFPGSCIYDTGGISSITFDCIA